MIPENVSEFELWIDFIRKGSFDNFIKYYKNEFLERPSNGKLPIHIACIHGKFEITQQLIDCNCNIESLDDGKWRPLHHASRENHLDIVKLLIQNKCEIDPINIDNWTPLHYASGYGHDKVVKVLIDNNSNIEAKTGDGWTPFHNACRFGHLENVKILLEKNCEIEIYDKDTRTPVHYACIKGYEEILQLLLLNKNCNIEACDKNNWRPIHHACANNKVQIVKMLLKKACNVDALTADSKSPLNLAEESNNDEIISILKETLEHRNLVNDMVSSMNSECVDGCDHKLLCHKSLQMKTFDKGELIGRGGYGKVYKIESSKKECNFAIKILSKEIFLKFYSKIMDEINSNKNYFIHKRIIKIYGSFIKDKKLIIFMEFASGGTIHDQINEKKTIPIDQVIHYSRQILEGLDFLHGLKIIHRDVKPSNILLTHENNVKLADFDLSRLTTGISDITTFCGTEGFVAPEMINDEKYTFSVDIWSLGATIINMITGNAPYHYLKIPQAIMFRIANDKKLEMPSNQMISDTMASFITTMLNPDPLSRPNASQLLQNEIFHQY